jgi:hypothetical protein
MADGIIFSDIMAHLVSRISASLDAQGFSNTRVSVLADESPSQVILRRDGGTRKSKTVMTSVVGINVYSANYSDAETLSNMVEAIFDDMADGEPIVATSAQSSIQDVSDLKSQRRFMR